MKISEDIELKLFCDSYVEDFYNSIHSVQNSGDEYRKNLQNKYDSLEKVHLRVKDAIENKYQIDGSPDFFIYYKGELCGVFEFHPIGEGDSLEIGYWLFAEYRRKGIISSVFPRMIQFARENFSKSKILATTSINNIPSQKLLEHVSFHKTGKVLKFENESGGYDEELEYIFNLVRSEIGRG